MKSNYLTTPRALKNMTCLLSSILLVACGGGGGSSSNDTNNSNISNGNVAQLNFTAPNTIPSLINSNGSSYVVVSNPGLDAITGIKYALINQVGGGAKANLDPTSVAACATIAAGNKCVIRVSVPANTVAGSFSLSATNNTLNRLMNKLDKANSDSTITANPIVGIGQVRYTEATGADGVKLYYYNTVSAGTPSILVTGVVSSSNAGKFNNVVLVDSHNNPLPNQEVISGNLGAGMTSLGLGATFSILLTAPSAANTTQIIKLKTEQVAVDGTITNTQISTTSSTLTTTAGTAIVNPLPNAIYLSHANPEQQITFSNTGDAIAQLNKMVSDHNNVKITFNPSSLSNQGMATATISLIDPNIQPTSSTITHHYNNGQDTLTHNIEIGQNLPMSNTPEPTPSPSPSPGPGPAPTPPAPTPPTANLTAQLAQNGNFFTTTKQGTVEDTLIITNNGELAAQHILVKLPDGFSISPAANNSCNISDGQMINDLGARSSSDYSCNLIVHYNNKNATTQSSDKISIDYDYNNKATLAQTKVAVNYQVTQSTANLNLTPDSSQLYNSIVSDNLTTSTPIRYTVINSGELDASDLSFEFTDGDTTLFNVLNSGSCKAQGSLDNKDNGNNSCTIDTVFGPAPNGITGEKNAKFSVGYNYLIDTTKVAGKSNQVALSGNVTQAPAANFATTIIADQQNVVSGDGTEGNPYHVYANKEMKVTVTYTNNSNVDAHNFTTNLDGLPTGWELTDKGCINIEMPAKEAGSCKDTYTLKSANSGANNLNLDTLAKISWRDKSGIYNKQNVNSETIYANVLARPQVSITPVLPIDEIMMGNSFQLVAELTSGVGTANISATLSDSAIGKITSNPSSCALNSTGTTSCIFTVETFWNNKLANGQLIASQINIAASDPTEVITAPIPFKLLTPTVYLQQTGQTSTSPISATEGMDGWIQSGVAGVTDLANRFENDPKDNRCIIDKLTGLEWVKDLNTIAIKGDSNGAVTPWQNAIDSIENSNNSSGYCGYNDWHLPTINELSSLQRDDIAADLLWLQSSGIFTNVPNFGGVWTSSISYANGGNTAVFIDLGLGYINSYDGVKSTKQRVWPVRKALLSPPVKIAVAGEQKNLHDITFHGTEWPANRFVSGTGKDADCITDKLTGLTWIKDPAKVFINETTKESNTTWQNAIDSINTKNTTTGYCGYNDWRLPNKNELKSLLNYSATDLAAWLMYGNGTSANPSCAGACFANIGSNYWTSTTNGANLNQAHAWNIYMFDGYVAATQKGAAKGVLPVRGGR
jgi:hypothetical protein